VLTDKREYFQPFRYPQAFEFLKRQEKIFWNAHEINVERDVHQFHVDFSASEKHMITTILRLFTQYELNVGCYWSDFVGKKFGGHWEVAAMAKMFSSMENVHALFYNKLNEGLYLNTPEFYSSYKDNSVLDGNVQITAVNEELSIEESLARLAFAEGVKLFGSFAVLTSFPRFGKLRGVENGLRYSIFDEMLHCAASCWLYKEYTKEANTFLSEEKIRNIAMRFTVEELALVDLLFQEGEPTGLPKSEVNLFVLHRADKVCEMLGYPPVFEVDKPTELSKWFYTFVNAQEDTDFFVSKATEYQQGWDFGEIIW